MFTCNACGIENECGNKCFVCNANAPQTSNEFYGALNMRFDERAAFMRSCGFKNKWVELARNCTIGYFIHDNPGFGSPIAFAASAIMMAEGMAWEDIKKDAERRKV